jgi:hypothetical protein
MKEPKHHIVKKIRLGDDSDLHEARRKGFTPIASSISGGRLGVFRGLDHLYRSIKLSFF